MDATPLDPTQKQTVAGKLARYALAGTSVFGFSAAADAAIIVNTTPQTVLPTQTINFNFNPSGDNITDFSVFASSPGDGAYIQVSGPPNTRFTTGLTPAILGEVITFANTTNGGGTLMKSHTGPTYNYPWGGVANGESRFLGVRFDIAGQTHLGWAEISMQKGVPSATVLRTAYETVAGESIVAGATESVPEPSSLALFAAGAAGLLALRRQRRAA